MSKAIQQFSPIGAVLFLCMLAFVDLHAQQSVGIGTAEPNPNAILELQSDRQGILVPRLSTSQRVQMAQILQTTSGNNGMIVFDKDNGKFFYWFDNQWNEGLGALSSSTVGGDLDGSLPSPIVVGLQGRPISSASPINDQVLKWNGAAWEPSQDVGMEYQAIEGLEITGNQIKVSDDAITTQKIADEAIITDKIADNAVTLDKIAIGESSTFLSIDANGILQWEDRSNMVTSNLGTGKIFIGNHAEAAEEQTMYGHITIAFDGETTIVDNSISSSMIIDGSILAEDIADEAIINEKIADEAVTESKLADQAIGLQKIKTTGHTNAILTINRDGEAVWFSPGNNRVIITTNDGQIFTEGRNAFATSALPEGNIFVGNSEGQAYPFSARAKGRILIGNGITLSSVEVIGDINISDNGNAEIQPNAITSNKILDGTIQTQDLSDASVTEAKIADNSVTTGKIADANITTAKLADNAITSAKILDGTILTEDLANEAVTNTKLAADAVTSEKILDGTIANADLDKGNILLSGFGAAAADVSMGSNRITQVADPTLAQDAATKSYVDEQIDASTDLEEGHVYIGDDTGKATAVDASAAGNILVGDGATINSVAVSGDIALAPDGAVTINDNAVTSAMILEGTIQTQDLSDASVTEAKIADDAVTTGKILDGTIANADLDKANIPLSGFGAAAADVDLGNNKLTQVSDPTDAQDAATKNYVDGQVETATDLEEGHVYIGDDTGKATAVDVTAAGNILVGDGTTINSVAVSGDIALATDGAVTINDNAVTSAMILEGTIQTQDLSDASVTEAKIADDAVTTGKIADANITTAKLADNAITSAKILDGTILTEDLADEAISNAKLAADAVTSEKILDGTIANADLDKANIPLSGFGAAAADVDLGSNKLTQVSDPTDAQDAATKNYVDGQVDASTDLEEGHVYIGDDTGKATAVDASAAGNILVGDGTTINSVAVSGDIALATDGAVTINDNAVTSAMILDGTIQAQDLSDASVTEAKIADDAVTTGKIADANITTAKVADNAITSAKILDGTILTEDLANEAVSNAKLAADAVTSEKILDGTITNADLDKANIPLSGFGAAAADVSMGSNRITQVADPTLAQDAATKNYVDALFATDGDQDDENEIQDLDLSSNILSLSLSGNTVDLSPYLDNTDSQNLGSSKTGNEITVTIDNGTATTFDISDGDNDPTNESLTAAVLDGTDLKLTESGNETVVDLSSLVSSGTRGSLWRQGTGTPAIVSTDLEGDKYLNTINGEIWDYNGSSWQNTTQSIRGPKGEEGAQGPQGLPGVGIGTVSPGAGIKITGTFLSPTTIDVLVDEATIDFTGNEGEGNRKLKVIAGSIGANELAANAVTAAKIDNDAITSDKLANGAVTSAKLDGMSATEGQVMTYRSGQWTAENPVDIATVSIVRVAYYAVDPLGFVLTGPGEDNKIYYYNGTEEADYAAIENFNAAASNAAASVAAPVHLPHGAKIEEIALYYWDNINDGSSNQDIQFKLVRKPRRNGSNEAIASFTSSGASATEQEALIASISNGTVDNSQYSYRIVARLRGHTDYGTSPHRLYSVIIKYSETIQND